MYYILAVKINKSFFSSEVCEYFLAAPELNSLEKMGKSDISVYVFTVFLHIVSFCMAGHDNS